MYNSEIYYWQLGYKHCVLMLNSRKMYLSRAVSAEYRRGKNWSRLSEEAVMKKPPVMKAYKRGVFLRFFTSDAIGKPHGL